jgi:hypothetical protein
MFLIPLNEIIEFNSTEVSASFLTGLYIAAFTYHPVYEHLLYILYSVGSITGTKPNLMLWNSYSKIFLQNITLTEDFNCQGRCTLKVTESLLLI